MSRASGMRAQAYRLLAEAIKAEATEVQAAASAFMSVSESVPGDARPKSWGKEVAHEVACAVNCARKAYETAPEASSGLPLDALDRAKSAVGIGSSGAQNACGLPAPKVHPDGSSAETRQQQEYRACVDAINSMRNRKAPEPGPDIVSLKQQASAWAAVFSALNEVSPDWQVSAVVETASEAAVRAIRDLAQKTGLVAKVDGPNGRLTTVRVGDIHWVWHQGQAVASVKVLQE